LVEEPVEEVSAAKKEKSFPTVIVAGLGILIMVLSAVTGMICLRGREKTNTNSVQEEQVAEVENVSPAQNEAPQSFEHLTQVMEKAPTDDSGSNGKNSE
jgi:type IV secretory pathway TrbF-like protein